ncbi:Hypothetical_protein [Hexamita inflata]|uniref:Hypothetical_protein n=1 Tax=Hexamita inflata TaxID=28002 RepID=A0ABP1J4V2_9EUKA
MFRDTNGLTILDFLDVDNSGLSKPVNKRKLHARQSTVVCFSWLKKTALRRRVTPTQGNTVSQTNSVTDFHLVLTVWQIAAFILKKVELLQKCTFVVNSHVSFYFRLMAIIQMCN